MLSPHAPTASSSDLLLSLLLLLLPQLVSEIDKKTGEVKPGVPRFVREGALVIAQLKTARSVCIETFDEMQQLGRFTLRDAGTCVLWDVWHVCMRACGIGLLLVNSKQEFAGVLSVP